MKTLWTIDLDAVTDRVQTTEMVDGTVVAQVAPAPDHTLSRDEQRPPYEVGIDPSTGSVLWQRERTRGWRHSVCIGELRLGTQIAGTKSELVALDADGQVVWKFSRAGEIQTPTLIDDEIVVAVGRTLHVLDRNGKLQRKGTVPKAHPQTVVAGPAGHYLCTGLKGSKTVFMVDRETFNEVWSVNVPGTWAAPDPLVHVDGVAVLHSYHGWAVAVETSTGETRWRRKKEAGRRGSCVALPGGDLLWGTAGLARVATSTGKPRWSIAHAASALALGDDRALVLRTEAPVGVEQVAHGDPEELFLDLVDLTSGATVATHPLGTGPLPRVKGDKTRERMRLVDDVVIVPAPLGRVCGVRLGC